MNFGIILSAGGPRAAADLAAEAEAAGWDGVFTFDAIAIGDTELYDPWVMMAAMAMRTERVRIGAILTPPARRRPWKLARETMTLDRLSGGRLILPLGLGTLDDAGFGNVGEHADVRARAERLDETLDILDGLWSGRPFAYHGRHFRFDEMTFLPTPLQRPRIPVWVAAAWPRPNSMRRALRADGILPQAHDATGAGTTLTIEHVRAIAEFVRLERAPEIAGRPFDIAVEGRTPAGDRDKAAGEAARWADAGATWWLESDWTGASVESLRARIGAGPPS
jgi:alkanesulfonate monooxygenase SsuD/methylene tetrahydromethanopterin reductase-like flavin-dependent oxidoreductase (luciferase family)